jgi:uncharacterized protein YdaU (DUF1376 family)
MAKLSFMKFYPYDWMNDTRSLSIEAKGCWIEILCLMWNAKERGRWTGTFQEFARVTGSPWESAPTLIAELEKVCTVTHRNDGVTLENRRMRREEKHYKLASNRQRRWRRNANNNATVTAKTLDVRLKTLDSQDNNKKKTTPSAPNKIGAGNPFWQPMVEHLDKTWTLKKRGSKYPWTGKDFSHLKRLAGIYREWGVMALWDAYLRSGDDWAIQHGYNVVTFAGQIPKLVDDFTWKQSAKSYEEKLAPANPEAINQLMAMTGSKSMSHV